MKTDPSAYAIVLNWNRFDDTVECIASLKRSSLPLRHILVLDQASPDASGKKLEDNYRGDDQIIVICNEKNYGFAAAANIGIQRALNEGAELIFLINNDTIVAEDCIQRLFEVLNLDPLAAAAGPAIMYYSNPEKLWQAGGFFSKLKMGVIVPGKGKRLRDIDQSASRATFLTGCALLIRRCTFERVGLFDTSYFFYGEDVDYSLRIRDEGMRMYFVPTAKVLHKIEDIATDRTSPFVLYHLAKSTMIMLRKRFSGLELWYGVTLQLTLYTAFRCWQIVIGGSGWDSVLAWFKGLFHGLSTKGYD
ncbi:MAG: glycosyltransferase family 2 protein [Bacteroidota bacterium]|jgi:GT2 family glycosyltransferase